MEHVEAQMSLWNLDPIVQSIVSLKNSLMVFSNIDIFAAKISVYLPYIKKEILTSC